MKILNAYQTGQPTTAGDAPAPAVPAGPNGGVEADSPVAGLVESGSSPAWPRVATLPQAPAVTVPRQAVAPAGVRNHAKPASMTLLYIWIALFGFVGTQLAWTLRPFFGSPAEPFQVFRDIEGTFYADIFRTIGHLLGL
jgi:hypothetical protein